MPHAENCRHVNYTSGSGDYLIVPADLATVYSFNPLFSEGCVRPGSDNRVDRRHRSIYRGLEHLPFNVRHCQAIHLVRSRRSTQRLPLAPTIVATPGSMEMTPKLSWMRSGPAQGHPTQPSFWLRARTQRTSVDLSRFRISSTKVAHHRLSSASVMATQNQVSVHQAIPPSRPCTSRP